MTSGKLRELDERIAALFRDDWPISTHAEPSQATSVDQPTDEPVLEAGVIEAAVEGGNATTMAEQPSSPLAGLHLDTAIRLRWVLRDIKAKRTKLWLIAAGSGYSTNQFRGIQRVLGLRAIRN